MKTEKCLLCKGSGQIEHPLRDDEYGRYYSTTEVKDEWLAELTAYCKENKKGSIPTAYALMLINQIWQQTYISLAAARENSELKERLKLCKI